MSREPLQSTARLKQIMGDYFRDLGAATTPTPVAWCTSVGPAELLRALGFRVFFPENHGAMLGATRTANVCMAKAHALGYSPDICSYLTSDIGAYLCRQTPLSAHGVDRVPRADVLVFNTNQCRDVRDWFEFYGREWNVPVIGVTSVRGVDEIHDELVGAIARQFEQLVAPLEAIAGTKLDPARLQDTLRWSRECTRLWKACLETATHRPAPWSFFDATIHMAPAVVLRGTPVACEYYTALLAELTRHAQGKVGAVEPERFRLYWEGMPIWGKLRRLADWFSELKATVVASTYCHSWVFEALDPADPFGSMARASLELFIARAEGPKERYLEQMARQYHIDGFVFHDARTCPNNSNTRYAMPQRLRQRLRIPVLVLDGDLNDLRCFSEEQAHTNIEGFIEQLAS